MEQVQLILKPNFSGLRVIIRSSYCSGGILVLIARALLISYMILLTTEYVEVTGYY